MDENIVSKECFTAPKMKSLTGEAASAIKKAILSGLIKPGEKVNETEIANLMKISRSPIREAINQLISEGLLEKKPNIGVFVTMPSEKGLKDLYYLRNLIERYSISYLIDNPRANTIDLLKEYVKNLEISHRNNLANIVQIDHAFHTEICKATDNELIFSIWKNVFYKLKVFFAVEGMNVEKLILSPDEHMKILDAILCKDKPKAKELITRHVMESYLYIKFCLFDRNKNIYDNTYTYKDDMEKLCFNIPGIFFLDKIEADFPNASKQKYTFDDAMEKLNNIDINDSSLAIIIDDRESNLPLHRIIDSVYRKLKYNSIMLVILIDDRVGRRIFDEKYNEHLFNKINIKYVNANISNTHAELDFSIIRYNEINLDLSNHFIVGIKEITFRDYNKFIDNAPNADNCFSLKPFFPEDVNYSINIVKNDYEIIKVFCGYPGFGYVEACEYILQYSKKEIEISPDIIVLNLAKPQKSLFQSLKYLYSIHRILNYDTQIVFHSPCKFMENMDNALLEVLKCDKDTTDIINNNFFGYDEAIDILTKLINKQIKIYAHFPNIDTILLREMKILPVSNIQEGIDNAIKASSSKNPKILHLLSAYHIAPVVKCYDY